MMHGKNQDKKMLKRINQILKDIDRNGYQGIGKPEALTGNLAGFWSRRIDSKNRIVYRIRGRTNRNCTMWFTLQR